MLRHFTFVALHDPARAADVLRAAEAVPGRIPVIRGMSAARITADHADEWTLVFTVDLDGREALQEYVSDPAHVAFARDEVAPLARAVWSIDCEL